MTMKPEWSEDQKNAYRRGYDLGKTGVARHALANYFNSYNAKNQEAFMKGYLEGWKIKQHSEKADSEK